MEPSLRPSEAPAKVKEYRRRHYMRNSQKVRDRVREWQRNNRKFVNMSRKERYQFWRDAVLVLLGGKCRCCNEKHEAFLAVDHISGGGNKDVHSRRETYYRRVVELIVSSPSQTKYQILCHNCNHAKSHYPGGCPHHGRG